ncbi:hypothetical protein ACLBYF_34015, partial [Methylobacterium brachiatum]
ILNYSMKHVCTSDYYDFEEGVVDSREWETAWLGLYYEWLYRWSRGHQSTRISIKKKRVEVLAGEGIIATNEKNNDLYEKEKELDVLPFVCSFSVLPIDYYYWKS